MKLTAIIFFLMLIFPIERAFSFGGLNLGGFWQNSEQPVFTKQLGQSPNAIVAATSVGAGYVDSNGNRYVGGTTTGNLPSCNGVNLNCSGGSQGNNDFYISKYNSSGVWQWTKQLGQTSKNVFFYGIKADSSGNVYGTGYTNANFSSCGGVSANCTGAGLGFEYFLVKYNSSGVYQWVKTLGQTLKTSMSKGIVIDTTGNVYIGGQTGSNLTTCSGVSANCTGASKGSSDYFITKYDTDGTWVWTQQLGQTSKAVVGLNLGIDSGNNIYISGNTNANIPSCSGASTSCTGTSQGTYDYFISKYTSAGVWVWSKQLGQTSTSSYGLSIATDPSNNVYVAGYSTGNITSCAGTSGACSGVAQGTSDQFISKYTSAGVWQWTKQLGQTGKSSLIRTIDVDGSGNIYAAGNTDGNLKSCNGVSSSCTGSSYGTLDYVFSKYDTAGAWQWTDQLGQTYKQTTGYTASLDSNGNPYLIGQTGGNFTSCVATATPCSGASVGGSNDYFIMNYNTSGVRQSVVQFGQGGKTTQAHKVATDSTGNVYISGVTNADLTSCSGVSANCTGNSNGVYDYYVSKYGPTGTWLWTKQLGSASRYVYTASVSIDGSNNIYVTGDTGANLESCSGVSASCSGDSKGARDFYITKYNSSGVWQWTSQLGSPTYQTSSYSAVAIDLTGNVFIGGVTYGNIASCNGVSTNCSGAAAYGQVDYHLSKYNSSGVWQWTKQMGQTNSMPIASANALATDSTGSVYIGGNIVQGNFASCAGVPGSCPTTASQGNTDYYISKYDASGAWQWTKQVGQTSTDTGIVGLTVDGSDNLYLAGQTTGNIVSCSGTSGACSGTSQGASDVHIAKYNSAGVWQWGKQLGQTSKTVQPAGINIDKNGDLIISGAANANLKSCKGIPANCTGASQGTQDYFILKYTTAGTWKKTLQFGQTGKTVNSVSAVGDSFGNIVGGGYTLGNYSSCNGNNNCSGSSYGISDYFIIKYRGW